jgi:S-formylglutathione hydrolase
MSDRVLAARGESPAAFGRRCFPAPPYRAEKRASGTPAADCVAPPSHIPDTAPHRAQHARWGPRSAVVRPFGRGPHGADCAPWGGSSGRLAALGATPDFHHGLLAVVRAVACGLALTALAATLDAQAGRGSRTGAVEHVKVHGVSLEGNLEGDSPDRDVTIYLPPSYATERARRYPVVYLLHGYGGTDSTWTGRLAALPEIADRLVSSGRIHELIVVMPNAFSLHKGSMYSNSVTTGDWERYIAQDLVAYVDSRYRTIADRMSRGLSGHSMGGYGALRIGMKRPDVFSSLYVLSACCLNAQMNPRPDAMAASDAIRTREDAVEAAKARGFGPSLNLALAAAWSPNPANPPLYLDLPVKDGQVRPEIVAKWAANAPLAMIDQYVPSLKRFRAIAIDIGTKDTLLSPNQDLDRALKRSAVPHTYEEYDGDHTDRIAVRLEIGVFPFFSNHLSFSPVKGQTSDK